MPKKIVCVMCLCENHNWDSLMFDILTSFGRFKNQQFFTKHKQNDVIIKNILDVQVFVMHISEQNKKTEASDRCRAINSNLKNIRKIIKRILRNLYNENNVYITNYVCKRQYLKNELVFS